MIKNLIYLTACAAAIGPASFCLGQDNYYYPQVFFNAKQAGSMLDKGTSVVEGVAFTKPTSYFGHKAPLAKKQFAPSGTVITLFPCTEYFYTWHRLHKRYADQKTAILMSAEAFSYHRQVVTDAYGRFRIKNLKPGKYYLEAVIPFVVQKSYQQLAGYTNYYNGYGAHVGSSPIYDTYFYNSWSANRESLFVEVTREGQLVEVKLK